MGEEEHVAVEEQVIAGEQAPEKRSMWPDYWRGTIVFSLLVGAVALFYRPAPDAMSAAFLCCLVFIIVYPCFLLSLSILRGNWVMFVIATFFMSGTPLSLLVFGGFMIGFSKLVVVRRMMKFYIPVVAVTGIVGSIINPNLFPGGNAEPEHKAVAERIEKMEPRQTPAGTKKTTAEKKAMETALPRQATTARNQLLAFTDLMETHYYTTEQFSDDVELLLSQYSGMKPHMTMSALREVHADGRLFVRVRQDSYEAALRWDDDQWWVYAFPRPKGGPNPMQAMSLSTDPPFDAIREEPEEPPARLAESTPQYPSGTIYSDRPTTARAPAPAPAMPAPVPTRPPEPQRSDAEWQRAQDTIQIGGVMKGREGRVALINNDVRKQGDTISVDHYGKTYLFRVADITQYDVVLERVED